MFCNKCGYENHDESRFCRKCGYKFIPIREKSENSSNVPPVAEIVPSVSHIVDRSPPASIPEATSLLHTQSDSVSNIPPKVEAKLKQQNDDANQHSINASGEKSQKNTIVFSTELVKSDTINGYSMKWFNTLVGWLIMVRAVIGIMLSLGNMANSITEYFNGNLLEYFTNKQVGLYNTVEIATYLIMVVLYISSIAALKTFSRKGYIYITIALFVEIVLWSLPVAVIPLMMALPKVVGILLICIPNIVYFYKRRSLFSN
jgi:hypothetical protein